MKSPRDTIARMTLYALQPWMAVRVTNGWDNTTADGDGTHTGADFPVGAGTPVTSPVAGTVTFVYVGTDAGGVTATYGWRVRVRDAFGRQHGFAHLHAVDVKAGQVVAVGTRLGLSGGALSDPKYKRGLSTGPHIHWGVYSGDAWTLASSTNPITYLAQRIAEDKPMTNRTTVAAGANVRTAPQVTAEKISALKGNWGYDVKGWITGGLVNGSTDWFVTEFGYSHSTGFTDPSRAGLANLNPVVPPPVVVPPVTPPATGGVTKAEVTTLIAASETRVLAAIGKLPVPATPSEIASAVDALQKQAGH